MSTSYTTLNFPGVYEKPNEFGYNAQRSQDGYIEKTYTFNLIVVDAITATDDNAHARLISYLTTRFGDPATYKGLPLSSMSLELQEPGRWDAVLTFGNTASNEDDYESGEPVESGETPAVGFQNIQFNFVSNQVHVNRSLQTVSTWYSGTAPIDFGGKINVDSSGVCQGVDLIKPEMTFSITINHARTSITPGVYFPTIFYAIGKVNNAVWGIFGAGTCLFMGADVRNEKYNSNSSGTESRDDFWQATYNFKYMPGAYITTPAGTMWADGWDYVWGYTTKGVQGEQLEQINVERVYPQVDFSTLFPWSWSL